MGWRDQRGAGFNPPGRTEVRPTSIPLRTKFLLYLIALHVVFAAAGVWLLLEYPLALFAVELLFAISLFAGYRLTRSLFLPLDLIRTGAELIAERDFTTRFVPVGQPEMDSLIAIYNRMIDRLRDERLAAEERHQLLQKVVQASPSGVVILDFDGKVEQSNPAAQRLVTPVVLKELETLQPGESRLIAGDGARRLKAWRAEFRDRGFPKSFFLIDELTEELRLTEKSAYEKLIRMMSHEVNNSVGAVRSLLESALRWAPQIGESDRDDYVAALTIASSRMDALNRFMSGFADVVRIPPPHRTPVRMDVLVRRIAALVRPECDVRHIALHVEAGEAVVDCDEQQIEQVVINVVRNAVDAIGNDGMIAMVLRDRELTVRDSGPGIADDVRHSLFTPFFTTKSDGRGLGLTIVQEILANHGFGYALRNWDGGAEFTIAFAGARSPTAPSR